MSPQKSDFVWSGQQDFLLVGTEAHEDTLRIESNYPQREMPLRLVLPTLCITYADMKFTNAIGGQQENYPASAAYGPKFFDPPLVITGKADVEKFTWIRGAHRVVIGSRETEIHWYPRETLIIPRLRIDTEKPATATLKVADVPIRVDEELAIKVKQLADGRHIGGIKVEKRHPQWQPQQIPQQYDFLMHVINGETLEPMPEVKVNLLRWDPQAFTPYGQGGFILVWQRHTDGNGVIHDPQRPSGMLEAVTLNYPGWRGVARCFRPLPGQRVRFHLRAWPLRKAWIKYRWKEMSTLASLAQLTGFAPEEILKHNRLGDPAALMPGVWISLPCYAATYSLEPRDTFEWLAQVFAYKSPNELAKVNGLGGTDDLDGVGVELPGWHFFYARQGDALPQIDALFDLPTGWSRPVGRVHHPDLRVPFIMETIAIPTKGFVKIHKK